MGAHRAPDPHPHEPHRMVMGPGWGERMLHQGRHIDHDRQPSKQDRMDLIDTMPDDHLEAPDRIVGEAA